MLIVSTHAVERYQERVKPHLGTEQARRELEALVALGTDVERPDYYDGYKEADRWIEVAPDVVVATTGEAVTTVIVEPFDEAARRAKNRYKAIQRQRKRGRRQGQRGHGNGRPEARVEAEAWPI